MSTTADMLGEVPLFALLDENERATLAERVDHETAKKGKHIFQVGQRGDAMYVVTSGAVEIWISRQTGDRVVLETARAGDFFGEISMLDGGNRNATATVLEDAELIVVDRGDLDELFRLKPAAAMDLLAATGRRLRETSKLLRASAAKDINEETEDKRSAIERGADWVTEFSGSIPFLGIHIVLFAVWIVMNVAPVESWPGGGFDPFPFGLLTMCVSLEAIILSVLVMLSQNRQIARDRIRNDIEYNVNVSAEAKVAHMHEKLDHLQEKLLARLEHLEQHTGVERHSTVPPAPINVRAASLAPAKSLAPAEAAVPEQSPAPAPARGAPPSES
jgi:CRP/FNR family transcriptional regulator, cyclic AMP receptor protein